MISLRCDSGLMCSWCSPPSPFVPGHLSGCCRGFPTVTLSLCSYPPAICPISLSSVQDVVEHFSARTLVSSSPPTLFAPLTARQSLSGQLTGSCRAFPATRAAGKRPSAALFDVPPLILFTWTALCAHFLLNRSSTYFLVLCVLLLSFLCFPCNTDHFSPW